MKEYKVRIEGISELLHHKFNGEGCDETVKKATSTLADYEAEVNTFLYKDDKGNIIQPSSHIEACLKKAGGGLKVKGNRSPGKLFEATLIVKPDEIPLKFEKMTVDKRPVRIPPRTGARVMGFRPKFTNWSCDFVIECLDDNMQGDLIKKALEHGGMYVGIGDYRPKFGRFKVTVFEEVENNT